MVETNQTCAKINAFITHLTSLLRRFQSEPVLSGFSKSLNQHLLLHAFAKCTASGTSTANSVQLI